MFDELNKVGDVVAEFIKNIYGRNDYNFNASIEWLKSDWLMKILNDKFGITSLDISDFDFDSNDYGALQYDKDIKQKYFKAKIFNVNKIKIYLNQKYD